MSSRLTPNPVARPFATVRIEKPDVVRARMEARERAGKHEAWLAGYEACERGEQKHSPYRGETDD